MLEANKIVFIILYGFVNNCNGRSHVGGFGKFGKGAKAEL